MSYQNLEQFTTIIGKPKNVRNLTTDNDEDWHDKYKDFRKSDEFSWLRIFIGLNLFFWWKVSLLIGSSIGMVVFLK